MSDAEAAALPVQIDATALHGDGFVIHAAALEDIIAAKTRANRPKDREVLAELHALRDAHPGS